MISFSEMLVNDKMQKLNLAIYELDSLREKRMNGYQSFNGSSRKFRYFLNSAKNDFVIEIVNKSDESFVAEISGNIDKSIDDIISELKTY